MLNGPRHRHERERGPLPPSPNRLSAALPEQHIPKFLNNLRRL